MTVILGRQILGKVDFFYDTLLFEEGTLKRYTLPKVYSLCEGRAAIGISGLCKPSLVRELDLHLAGELCEDSFLGKLRERLRMDPIDVLVATHFKNACHLYVWTSSATNFCSCPHFAIGRAAVQVPQSNCWQDDTTSPAQDVLSMLRTLSSNNPRINGVGWARFDGGGLHYLHFEPAYDAVNLLEL